MKRLWLLGTVLGRRRCPSLASDWKSQIMAVLITKLSMMVRISLLNDSSNILAVLLVTGTHIVLLPITSMGRVSLVKLLPSILVLHQ